MVDIPQNDKLDYIIEQFDTKTNEAIINNLSEKDYENFKKALKNFSNDDLTTIYNEIMELNNERKKINDSLDEFKKTIICPITLKTMKDPWSIAVCNHTFDKEALSKSDNFENDECPLCG